MNIISIININIHDIMNISIIIISIINMIIDCLLIAYWLPIECCLILDPAGSWQWPLVAVAHCEAQAKSWHFLKVLTRNSFSYFGT